MKKQFLTSILVAVLLSSGSVLSSAPDVGSKNILEKSVFTSDKLIVADGVFTSETIILTNKYVVAYEYDVLVSPTVIVVSDMTKDCFGIYKGTSISAGIPPPLPRTDIKYCNKSNGKYTFYSYLNKYNRQTNKTANVLNRMLPGFLPKDVGWQSNKLKC